MANEKILNLKKETVSEIADKTKNSGAVVLFEYHGLSVAQLTDLRRKLRDNDSELKVYKNTLAKLAFDSLDIDFEDHLNGPKAFAFGKDPIVPVKILSEFAKKNKALVMKVGYVDGSVVDASGLQHLSTIPGRDGLYTMLAYGMIAPFKNLAIALDLYSKEIGGN
jgi:large subunit ribosomal protein L10